MTETEKEIALLRHEANRLRLFGRMTSSKVLADKAAELERGMVTAEAFAYSMHQVIARHILRHQVELFEALCEDGRPIYAPPSVVASEVARMVANHPESVPVGTWAAIKKAVVKRKMELQAELPITTDVDFVISWLDGKINA